MTRYKPLAPQYPKSVDRKPAVPAKQVKRELGFELAEIARSTYNAGRR